MNKYVFVFLSALVFNSLFASKSAAQTVDPNEPIHRLNTMKVLQNAIDNMPACIEYCIEGVVLKVVFYLGVPHFFWTLRVSHNAPNWLTLTHPELDQTALTEFNIVFGKPYKKMSEVVFKKPLEVITKTKLPEIGGGRERHKAWGQHQAVQFSEATVMGSPASMILEMFDHNGIKLASRPGRKGEREPCRTHGCLEDLGDDLGDGIRGSGSHLGNASALQNSGSGYLQGWQNGRYQLGGLLKLFNYLNIHDAIAASKSLISFVGNLSKTLMITAKVYGARIDRLFCPMEIAPYQLYYLSGFDSYAWRMGYPITDPNHSATILNPLSKDRLGTRVKETFNIAGTTIKTPAIDEYWGNIFPRTGTVNIQNTAKMGAIVGYRANHILAANDNVGRVYRKPHENTVGVWSKEIPPDDATTPGQKPSACHRNIANTGIRQHADSTYAYTSWPKYHCDLAGGKTVAVISLSTCLTSRVPE